MAWCHQATSHYLYKCWHRSIPPYGVIKPQWVNHLMEIRGDGYGCGGWGWRLGGDYENLKMITWTGWGIWLNDWQLVHHHSPNWYDFQWYNQFNSSYTYTSDQGYDDLSTFRVDSRFVPSQWKMALLCNVSHWQGASLESTLTWWNAQLISGGINGQNDYFWHKFIKAYAVHSPKWKCNHFELQFVRLHIMSVDPGYETKWNCYLLLDLGVM